MQYAEVIAALTKGDQEVQWRRPNSRFWYPVTLKGDQLSNFSKYEFRIKPESIRIPLTQDELDYITNPIWLKNIETGKISLMSRKLYDMDQKFDQMGRKYMRHEDGHWVEF